MKKILLALNGILIAIPGVNFIQEEYVLVAEDEVKNVNITMIINVNFASVQKLESVDGISLKIAQAIVEHRENNGFFKNIEQLLEVKGIGPVTYEKIKDKLSV